MTKFKQKLSSLEDGKKFMNSVSELTGLVMKEVEEYLKCENDEISVSCQLMQNGRSFVIVETENQELLTKIQNLL
ncbi:MAG: hypothetical protein ACW99Q_10355 [Candidatus Kariarchaeaceae archaeon]|jgi:hypothetical protein